MDDQKALRNRVLPSWPQCAQGAADHRAFQATPACKRAVELVLMPINANGPAHVRGLGISLPFCPAFRGHQCLSCGSPASKTQKAGTSPAMTKNFCAASLKSLGRAVEASRSRNAGVQALPAFAPRTQHMLCKRPVRALHKKSAFSRDGRLQVSGGADHGEVLYVASCDTGGSRVVCVPDRSRAVSTAC